MTDCFASFSYMRWHDIAELHTRLHRGERQSNRASMLSVGHNHQEARATPESVVIVVNIYWVKCQVPQLHFPAVPIHSNHLFTCTRDSLHQLVCSVNNEVLYML